MNTPTKTRLQQKADAALEWFTQSKRDNGDEFFYLKDGAPEWVEKLVETAHGEFFPDDYRYAFIREALIELSECEGDPAEITMEPDVYNGQLTHWLASNINRPAYVDEIVGDIGHGENIVADIALGQQREKEEVFNEVWDFLQDEIEKEDSK